MTPFESFVAVDWSGAKGRRHKGIAVAQCQAGEAAPILVRPGHVWSRTDVLNFAAALSEGGPRTLIAFDFSFAPPFVERGSYLPGTQAPEEARAFWLFVDAHSEDEDLGAASFLERRFRTHFYFGAADGRKADYMFARVCEAAFNAAGGGKPSTVYDAIGAAQVAKASFAGMRLLHRLPEDVHIWPFDGPVPNGARVVVAEMYARLFLRLAGDPRGRKLRDTEGLNRALAALGSQPADIAAPDDHQTDALVAAAGLRAIAGDGRYWQPAGMTAPVARTEGWTLGVL